jgi:hypothetical protein
MPQNYNNYIPDHSLCRQVLLKNVGVCDHLLAMTRSLCRRSEPLDAGWKTCRETLLHEIDMLEALFFAP